MVAFAILFLSFAGLEAQSQSVDVVLDSGLLAGYQWRNIGPDRGGRSIAASGVRGRPNEGYFGATGGGLWKTVDSGENWFPVTDFQVSSASVGAVAVSETDPDLVFIGMGETAEILAREGSISRDEQEEFAIKSHEKALDAWENGRFDDEVMPTDMYDDMRTLNMLYEELCWDHEDELEFTADYVNDRIIVTN